ncbi:MAG TPA: NAD(+) diphosphatase [Gammaproteobacteria bacterium]|nr:NAD(+) diphosphatase [Gammaproteobacteria bacterium]
MNWLGDQETRWQPGLALGKLSRVIVTSDDRMIAVDTNGDPLLLDLDDAVFADYEPVLAGTLNDVNYYGVRGEKICSLRYEPLRPSLIQIRSAQFVPVSAAMQVLDFSREHQFCGQCGRSTSPSKSDRGRTCESCQLTQYPRISPCVIVLVTRSDEILLARAPRFVAGMYSTLAGFVEAGESAEHACHREIFEEVGVEISKPVYQGSQSWPFKHSLMLGYRAEWRFGDIRIDENEIIDAQWFKIDNLPKLPPKASISRGMIDAFISERVN